VRLEAHLKNDHGQATVDCILSHDKEGRYKVRWVDGTESWEPRTSFVDVDDVTGEEIITEALQRYLVEQQ
jgi:hypothetical protein